MALRTSIQVMSDILMEFGSGAVSGRPANASASAIAASAMVTILSVDCRLGMLASGSPFADRDGERGRILRQLAFDTLNQIPAPLRCHSGTRRRRGPGIHMPRR